MGILRHGKAALAAAAITLLTATGTASAQMLSFYTTGAFGGAGCGGFTTQCTFGGGNYTINYNAVPQDNPMTPANEQPVYFSPSTVKLGTFTVAGTSGTTETISNADFTLTIWQTVPGAGIGTFYGNLTGTFKQNTLATGNNLIWVPQWTSLNIYSAPNFVTTYDLLHVNSTTGGIHFTGAGTTIEAYASVAPEPGTLLLLAPGLAGLVGSARIRRRNKNRSA